MTQKTEASVMHQGPFLVVAIADVKVNGNVRSSMDEQALKDLTDSIQEKGVMQPITIASRRVVKTGEPHYTVVTGHRRLEAAKRAGMTIIPALLHQVEKADELIERQVVENLQREDLHPLDEAQAYWKLVMEHGADVGRIATKIGKTGSYIFDRIQLTKLIPEIVALYRAGTIKLEHAIILARLKPADQKRCAEKPVNRFDRGSYVPMLRIESTIFGEAITACSPRELQSWIDQHIRFDRTDPILGQLFPETTTALKAAEISKTKVVAITEDYNLKAEARDGKERTFTPQTFRPVGKKSCDYQVLGCVAAGANRGKTYLVCTRKDVCKIHWAKEVAAKQKDLKTAVKKGASAKEARAAAVKKEKDRYAEEERQRKIADERWKKAQPEVEKHFAHAILGDKITPTSPIGRFVQACSRNKERTDRIVALIGKDWTPEGMLRFLAMDDVLDNTHHAQAWGLPDIAKLFGVDVRKIVAEANGDPAPAPKAKKAAKKK